MEPIDNILPLLFILLQYISSVAEKQLFSHSRKVICQTLSWRHGVTEQHFSPPVRNKRPAPSSHLFCSQSKNSDKTRVHPPTQRKPWLGFLVFFGKSDIASVGSLVHRFLWENSSENKHTPQKARTLSFLCISLVVQVSTCRESSKEMLTSLSVSWRVNLSSPTLYVLLPGPTQGDLLTPKKQSWSVILELRLVRSGHALLSTLLLRFFCLQDK